MMQIEINSALILSGLLMLIRVSSALLLSPLFAFGNIPMQIRMIWMLGLVWVLMSGSVFKPVLLQSSAEFISAAVGEWIIGAVLGFGVFCAFAALQVGGRLLDFQMGFGIANLIDPATDAQSSLLGTILGFLAVILFFLVDGHHMVLKGLQYSFVAIPLGSSFNTLPIAAISAQFGAMFVFGLIVVAPVIALLFFVDLGMAVAARTMPQVNVFILGIPLKILLGLMMLALSMGHLVPVLNKIFASIFQYWEQVGVRH